MASLRLDAHAERLPVEPNLEVGSAAALEGNPYLEGIHQPLEREYTVGELVVVGDLPPTLAGSYMRNGPNPIDAGGSSYHWFTGDAMIHALRIEDGRAIWYKNRWIRSTSVAEAKGLTAAPGPRHSPFEAVNTNVAAIAGRTYALVEGGSTPVELSDDLEEQAFSDFGGTLKDSFTAHPHLDPRTGEQHAITYNGRVPNLAHHVVIDRAGKVVRELPIPVEHGPSIHDCALTQRYIVIFDLPVTLSIKAAMSGSVFPYRWNPEHRARVGLLPRTGNADEIVWCDVKPAYLFHALNGYDAEDGKVIVDVCAYERMFDGNPLGVNAPSRGLERWTIDPVARRVDVDTIDPTPQDFPRLDERWYGQPHRYGFTMAAPTEDGEQSDGGVGLFKHDLEKNGREFHDCGSGRYPGEFVFVPRTPDSAEGDGWLVGLVLDSIQDKSELVVIDSLSFEEKPVARVLLPHRVPPGFHGNWISRVAAQA